MTRHAPAQELQLPATYNSLTTLGLALRHYLAAFNLDESWVYSLDLAVCEAATNIIRHGYHDKSGPGYQAHFSHDATAITVTLCDSGLPVPETQLKPSASPRDDEIDIDTLSESGRGMQLIYSCVDRVSYLRSGSKNQLSLIKTLPPGTP